ncbi:hypothetical protein PLIIFM63780_003503 [Purpureocillium lilacinum]|nr:hypothetical protein PLIIFM63780_003503 [Purpureocillium lilacinum]
MSTNINPLCFPSKLPDIRTEAIPPWGLPERSYYDLTPEDEILDFHNRKLSVEETSKAASDPIVAVIGVGYVTKYSATTFPIPE